MKRTIAFSATALLAFPILTQLGCSASINIDGDSATSYSRVDHSSIDAVLDGWHQAAAAGELKPYIESMTEGSVFMGTDVSERWTRDELQGYAEQYFGDGEGWVYVPRDRHIRTNAFGDIAWIDEVLDNEKYGVLRGTGVLKRNGDVWKIAHYSLTFLVPNESAKDVVEVIRGGGSMDSGG
ncbi:MAG: nuclear transport factor 2 family protein [Phycisphaerales bacterium]